MVEEHQLVLFCELLRRLRPLQRGDQPQFQFVLLALLQLLEQYLTARHDPLKHRDAPFQLNHFRAFRNSRSGGGRSDRNLLFIFRHFQVGFGELADSGMDCGAAVGGSGHEIDLLAGDFIHLELVPAFEKPGGADPVQERGSLLVFTDQDSGHTLFFVEQHRDFDGPGIAELPFGIADGFQIQRTEHIGIVVANLINSRLEQGEFPRFRKYPFSLLHKRFDRFRHLRADSQKRRYRCCKNEKPFH